MYIPCLLSPNKWKNGILKSIYVSNKDIYFIKIDLEHPLPVGIYYILYIINAGVLRRAPF